MNKVYVMGGAQTDFERNWSREGRMWSPCCAKS